MQPTEVLIIEPRDGYDLKAMNGDKDKIVSLFNEHRVIWFKGFNSDVDEFTLFCDFFCKDFSDYQGGGSRWKAINREIINNDKTLMTATGSTQNFTIPLHGEMYYMKNPPELIFFYCLTPAQKGGQTILCNGTTLLKNLDNETRKFFFSNKIKYIRYLPDGDWQTAFMLQDYKEVEEFCYAKGVSVQRDEKNTVTTEFICEPVIFNKNTNEHVFINNILYIYFAEKAFREGDVMNKFEHGGSGEMKCPIVVRMENGEEIPYNYIERLMTEANKITVDINWQKGDIVMIDNTTIMHGRKKSPGDKRKLLVKMGSPVFEF